MVSTSTTISSHFLPSTPFLSTHKVKLPCTQTKRASTIICESRKEVHDKNYYRRGRLVDENMIVLRKRIREKEMADGNYEPPSNWMDWEKNCYAGYNEFVCEAMELLQSQFMNIRPSLALGMVAVVALSVPISAAVVMFPLMDIVKGVVAGVRTG